MIRFGLLGCGRIAKRHSDLLGGKQIDGACLMAVCDPIRERADAIAAKFAHPDRPVIAIVGDGAFEMNGMNELITIAKYWRRWSDPRLVVMVLDNRDLNQVTWEQRAFVGDPKFPGSQDIPAAPYAQFARMLGLDGFECDDPDRVGEAWDRALAATRPFVLAMRTDPDVPPLPPHISLHNAKAYASALLKGDPDAGGVLRQSIKELLA